MDGIKGVGDLFSKGVDAAEKALESVAPQAVRLIDSLREGDVVAAFQAGASLFDSGPTTEHAYSQQAQTGEGYPARTDPADAAARKCLQAVKDNLMLFDNALGWPIPDGLVSPLDVQAVAINPLAPPSAREAAQYLLQHPEMMARLDVAAGVGAPDGLFGVSDLDAALSRLTPHPTKPFNWIPDFSVIPHSEGGTGKLDPNLSKFQDALETLAQNWPTFDSAAGNADQSLSRADLKAMMDNTEASPELRKAATFLLTHPEYFDRLEMAAGLGGKDGLVGLKDVLGELKRITEDIAKYGAPAAAHSPAATGQAQKAASAASSSAAAKKKRSHSSTAKAHDTHGNKAHPSHADGRTLRDVLNDPTLSLDEKIELILREILASLDEKIVGTTESYDESYAAFTDSQEEDSDGTAAKSPQQQLAEKKSSEDLMSDLQKLVERRKQMFELMSNLSMKFNEMSNTALSNLARA